jgi:hypothetical protein
MTLTYVLVKGSALNLAEFDGNTAEIAAVKDRVATLEGGTLVSITSVTQAGPVMTLHFSNATTASIVLPVRDVNDRGTWAPDTSYYVDDYFDDNNGGWFRVQLDHISGATFDEFANDGAGHNYYRRLSSSPANSFPSGGELGQVIMKLSATEQHKGWRFLDAIYLTFDPSSDSDIPAGSVAAALEWLEGRIATAIASAIGAVEATDVGFSPSSPSGLASTNAGDAINELAERATGFADLTGTIKPSQRDATVTALGTTGAVSLDPSLGDVFTITPTGNVTLNAAATPANARITIFVTTSGTSSFNITFGTGFISAGVLPTGTVSGKTFAISFGSDGAHLIECAARTAAM